MELMQSGLLSICVGDLWREGRSCGRKEDLVGFKNKGGGAEALGGERERGVGMGRQGVLEIWKLCVVV